MMANNKIDRRVYKNLNSSSIISRYVRDLKKAKVLEQDRLSELEDLLLLIQKRSAEEALTSIQINVEHYIKNHAHIEDSFFNPKSTKD